MHTWFAERTPWDRPSRSWWRRFEWIQLSQGSLLVLGSLFIAIIVSLVMMWAYYTRHLVELDDRISETHENIVWGQQRLAWSKDFIRMVQAVDWSGGHRLRPEQKKRLVELLWDFSRNYRFDPLVVVAVMQVESRSTPWAVGRYLSGAESGALGLMQVKLATAQLMARDLGVEIHSEEDLFKPEINMYVGTYYLMRLLVRTGSFRHALVAYNIGPAALAKKIKEKQPIPQRYVKKILKEYQILRQRFGAPQISRPPQSIPELRKMERLGVHPFSL